MFTFQEQALKAELDSLPPRSRVAFAASCAQRLVGVYQQFALETKQLKRTKLEYALDYLWGQVLTCPTSEQTEQILVDTMALVPAEDSPGWTPLTAYAEDAVSAVAYALRCLLSYDAQEAAWAARRVYEALDHFVIDRNHITPDEPGAEDRILGHPLVQAEFARQSRDIAELRSAGESLSPSLLDSLRQRSSAEQAIVLAD